MNYLNLYEQETHSSFWYHLFYFGKKDEEYDFDFFGSDFQYGGFGYRKEPIYFCDSYNAMIKGIQFKDVDISFNQFLIDSL